jgi:squalene synthase HpnC
MQLSAELAKYGPAGAAPPAELEAARRYCREMATSHYENYTVVSWLLPRALRQHFCNLYAYCRWADDLADETADPRESLALLDWWEAQVHALPDGPQRHPVFVALADTIREFQIPREPLLDLLTAFRQDQRQSRYETFDDLLGYCRNSANPVGRLVLYLGRACRGEAIALSDSICTGLQLANFCQDVARDYDRGRIYLPLEDCRRHGFGEEQFAAGVATPAFRELLAFQVARAEQHLARGWPLVSIVPRELRLSVRLFISGGLAILAAIRRQQYDVWTRRPVLSKRTRLVLLARACCGIPSFPGSSLGTG